MTVEAATLFAVFVVVTSDHRRLHLHALNPRIHFRGGVMSQYITLSSMAPASRIPWLHNVLLLRIALGVIGRSSSPSGSSRGDWRAWLAPYDGQ
jgi:hypothetical protein